MKPTSMTCPYIKQVVMLYCDACPTKKMVPLDQIVSASPCLAQTYEECSLYKDVIRRLGTGAEDAETAPLAPAGSGREVSP